MATAKAENPSIEDVAAAALAADAAAALAASAPAIAPVAKQRTGQILVSGVLADQVNPLTSDRIPHGTPKLVMYDRWIEIQLEAGVLAETKMM